MYYVVQIEEIEVSENGTSAVDVWDETIDGNEYFDTYEEAKIAAGNLLELVRKYQVEDVYYFEDRNNHSLAIVISEYNDDWEINDVIDFKELSPDEYNPKCGSCGAYMDGGSCYKYGHRVSKYVNAEECYHGL